MYAFCALAATALSAFAHPQGEPKEPPLLGLLDMPLIYETEGAAALVPLYEEARPGSPTVGHLDTEGIGDLDRNLVCRWREENPCPFAESGYEVPALEVYATAEDDWYRVRVDLPRSQYGWLRSQSQYHPLLELLAGGERLTYLSSEWDGRLYRQPGAGASFVPIGREERQAEVVYEPMRHELRAGRLWIEVKLMTDPCSEEEPAEIARGWVPVTSEEGVLWAWFFSRGC